MGDRSAAARGCCRSMLARSCSCSRLLWNAMLDTSVFCVAAIALRVAGQRSQTARKQLPCAQSTWNLKGTSVTTDVTTARRPAPSWKNCGTLSEPVTNAEHSKAGWKSSKEANRTRSRGFFVLPTEDCGEWNYARLGPPPKPMVHTDVKDKHSTLHRSRVT